MNFSKHQSSGKINTFLPQSKAIALNFSDNQGSENIDSFGRKSDILAFEV